MRELSKVGLNSFKVCPNFGNFAKSIFSCFRLNLSSNKLFKSSFELQKVRRVEFSKAEMNFGKAGGLLESSFEVGKVGTPRFALEIVTTLRSLWKVLGRTFELSFDVFARNFGKFIRSKEIGQFGKFGFLRHRTT